MTTALTLPQRAAVALGSAEHEQQLALLASEAGTIVAIKNRDARDQCHTMMMALKNARIAIEKAGKMAREDAQAFSSAVIAEQKRLIGITEAEETRLQELRDGWDAAIEAEKQRKITAERKRVADIQDRIKGMRNLSLNAFGKPSEVIQAAFEIAADIVIDESFAEFADLANDAKRGTLQELQGMLESTLAQEAEAARLKAEREELDRLRAEQERQASEILARQAAELQAARQQQEAELAAQRAELDRQRKEHQAQLAEQERQAKALQVEQHRRDLLEQERIATERRAEEARRLAAAQLEDARLAALAKAERPALSPERPSDAAIISALSLCFHASAPTVIGWLASMDLARQAA